MKKKYQDMTDKEKAEHLTHLVERRRKDTERSKLAGGKYKILVRSHPVHRKTSRLDKRKITRGETVAVADTIASARRKVRRLGKGRKPGTQLYIRQSNAAKRKVFGYNEPNVEGYVVDLKGPVKVWSSPTHAGMPQELDKMSKIAERGYSLETGRPLR